MQILKRLFSKSYMLIKVVQSLRNFKYSWGGVIDNDGVIKIKRFVKGKNNKIVVGKNTYLERTSFRIVGNNNIIEFGDNVWIGDECSFWAEGYNIRIFIGAHSSFTRSVHVNA